MSGNDATDRFNDTLFEVIVSSTAISKYDDNVLMNRELERFFIQSLTTSYPVKISCFKMMTLFEQKTNFRIGVMLDVFDILNIIDDYIYDLSELIFDRNTAAMSFIKRLLVFRKEIFLLVCKALYHYKHLDQEMIFKNRSIFAFAKVLSGQKEKGSDRFKEPPLSKEQMDLLYPTNKQDKSSFGGLSSNNSNVQKTRNMDEILNWVNT